MSTGSTQTWTQWLFTPSYGSLPELIFKGACQIGVGTATYIFISAINGNTCGKGTYLLSPQTWGNGVGCFLHNMVDGKDGREVDFVFPDSAQPANTDRTIVAPQAPVELAPLPEGEPE